MAPHAVALPEGAARVVEYPKKLGIVHVPILVDVNWQAAVEPPVGREDRSVASLAQQVAHVLHEHTHNSLLKLLLRPLLLLLLLEVLLTTCTSTRTKCSVSIACAAARPAVTHGKSVGPARRASASVATPTLAEVSTAVRGGRISSLSEGRIISVLARVVVGYFLTSGTLRAQGAVLARDELICPCCATCWHARRLPA